MALELERLKSFHDEAIPILLKTLPRLRRIQDEMATSVPDDIDTLAKMILILNEIMMQLRSLVDLSSSIQVKEETNVEYPILSSPTGVYSSPTGLDSCAFYRL